MDFLGLPLHPLVVHAAVVLTPIAAVAVVVYALWPSLRWLTRWPAVLLTVASLGAVATAWLSGRALLADRPFLTEGSSPVADLLQTHQSRATVLLVAMVVLTALVLVAHRQLGGPSGLLSGRGAVPVRDSAWATRILPGALVLVGVAVLVLVGLTGDAGARAVWG